MTYLLTLLTRVCDGFRLAPNQLRNIPRRQRISRFPPGTCRCFPPKIAIIPRGAQTLFPRWVGAILPRDLHLGSANLTPLIWLGLPDGLQVGSKTYADIFSKCVRSACGLRAGVLLSPRLSRRMETIFFIKKRDLS